MSRMRRHGRKILLPLVMGVAALLITWSALSEESPTQSGRVEYVAALTDADINWT